MSSLEARKLQLSGSSAMQQKLKLFSDQLKRTQESAPPPSSAYDFAGAIMEDQINFRGMGFPEPGVPISNPEAFNQMAEIAGAKVAEENPLPPESLIENMSNAFGGQGVTLKLFNDMFGTDIKNPIRTLTPEEGQAIKEERVKALESDIAETEKIRGRLVEIREMTVREREEQGVPTLGNQWYQYRPLRGDEARPNEDGTQSTELTITVQDEDGKFLLIPSLWTDGADQREMGDEEAHAAAVQYEQNTGYKFPRFDTPEEAAEYAMKRSEGGGAAQDKLAKGEYDPAGPQRKELIKEKGKLPPEQSFVLNVITQGVRGAANMGISAVEAPMVLLEAQTEVFYDSGEKSMPRQQLDKVRKLIDEIAPVDRGRADDFVTKLASGSGSMLAFWLAGVAGSALGLGMTSTIAGTGAAIGAVEQYTDAERFETTGLQRYWAMLQGGAIGLSEAVSFDRFFMRLFAARGPVVKEFLANMTATGLEEGIQEAGQEFGKDVVAKLWYDTERELDFERYAESGAVGFLTGAGMSGSVMALGGASVVPDDVAVGERLQIASEVIDTAQQNINKILMAASVPAGEGAETSVPSVGTRTQRLATAAPVSPPGADVELERAAPAQAPSNPPVTAEPASATPPAEPVNLPAEVVEAQQEGVPPAEVPAAVDAMTLPPQPTAEDYLARMERPTQEFEGGELPVNDDGMLELTHFSTAQLDVIDPAKRGTGPLRGDEQARLFGPDAVDRSYYGVDALPDMPNSERRKVGYQRLAKGGYIKEGGLGDVAHTVVVDPNRVYNWYQDPFNLKAGLDRNAPLSEQKTRYERLIRDAGFDGYYVDEGPRGRTVAMFTPEVPLGAQPDSAADELDALVTPEKAQSLAQQIPGMKAVFKYLTPDEQIRMSKRFGQALLDAFSKLPSPKEMAAVAVSGRAKKGWYANSANAILNVFGAEDAPRFAALLAALSPQTSVQSNLTNALKVWTAWVRANRPTDRAAIRKILGENVEGDKGEKSVLDAWINNSTRALIAADPKTVKLSGPKVNSFMLNLMGVTNEVTNDAWMANFANVDQALFASSRLKNRVDDIGKDFGEKSPGYIAMSVAVRAAADAATKLTGEVWTPAEIQETVWSWAKALYEGSSSTNSALNVLTSGGLTADMIASVPDFGTLFTGGVFEQILRQGGYGGYLDRLKSGDGRSDAGSAGGGDVFTAEGTAIAPDNFQRDLKRAARRLDKLRRRRIAEENAAAELKKAEEAAARGEQPDFPGDRTVGTSLPGFEGVSFRLAETFESETDYDVEDLYDLMEVPQERVERLPGLPESSTGPVASVVKAAKAYARNAGLPFRRQAEYVRVDVDRAKRIAQAYEEMEHNPDDPQVKAAFEAMAKETLAQYQFVKASGLKVDFIEEGQADPYPEGPKQVLDDLQRGHLWVFPTDQGFGARRLPPVNDTPGTMMDNYSGKWEMVPISWLEGFVGNELRSDTAELQADIEQNGISNPLIINVGKTSRTAVLGEGNHRLAALKAAGYTHAPVRVIVGANYGKGKDAIRDDLIPVDGEYFMSDARPSQVFTSIPAAEAEKTNPLLAPTDEYVNGRQLLVNDVFRIVHDFFGHGLEGSGFGARGEENAWQSHMRLYSAAALPAVTSETRGQNSWVNYGPHGEANRANQKETIYADQKTGLMPPWTWQEGVVDDVEASEGTPLAEQPVEPTDFIWPNEDTFRRPGWAIVTALREGATDAENQAAQDALEKELAGTSAIPVEGRYKGVDQGRSWIVFSSEVDPRDIGTRYGQESILTRNGLEYMDGRPATPAVHEDTIVGDEARTQDFYSETPSGVAFTVGLDFSDSELDGMAAGRSRSPARGTSQVREPFVGEPTRPTTGIPTDPNAPVPAEFEDLNLRTIASNVVALLKLTARQGRLTLKGGAVGQYDTRQRSIRLTNQDDLSTLVHEAGHAIHDDRSQLLEDFITQNERWVLKAAHHYYPGDLKGKPLRKQRREGFAEMFRVWTLNPANLHREVPELARAWEALLDQNMPDLRDGLIGVRQQFAAWLQMPSAQLIRNLVVPATRPSKSQKWMADLADMGFRTWMNEYARDIVSQSIDRYGNLAKLRNEILNLGELNTGTAIDLKRAEDPVVRARMARNAPQRGMVQLSDGAYAHNGTEPVSRGVRDALLISQGVDPNTVPRAIDQRRMEDFDAYLVALRARDEISRRNRGIIDRNPIGAHDSDIDLAITEYEAQYGNSFKEAAQIMHDYNMVLWQKAYDAGLMNEETYRDGLTRGFYVPLQRDMTDRGNNYAPNPITGGGNFVKRFRGSDRPIISPVAMTMAKTFAIEQTIAQNEIVRALAKLADRAGKAGAFVERVPANQIIGEQFDVKQVAQRLTQSGIGPADAHDLMLILDSSIKNDATITMFKSHQASTRGENVLFFWEDGKVAAIRLTDGDVGNDVVNMMSALGRENMEFGMSVLAMTSSVFRSSITSWPDFLMVNFVRDQLSAWILTDVGYKPFLSGARGVRDEIMQRKLAKQYNAAMGIMGGMNVAALHELQVARDLDALRAKGYFVKAFNSEPGFKGKLKGLAKITELTETGTRLGLFKHAFDRAKADGLTDWEASVEAAYIATDYIDFGLNGSRMLHARRLIPFLNAQLQGYYKMMRTLGGDEVAQRKGLQYALKAYFKNINNLPLSRVEKNALRTGRKAWIKMASIGLISAAIHFLFAGDPDYEERSEYLAYTGWMIPVADGKLVWIPKPFELAIVSNIVERALETASGDPQAINRFLRGFAMQSIPPHSQPLIQQIVEQSANYDFFSGREIVPQHMQSLQADLQYDEYTTELALKIASITGLSPMAVDHFMSGMGASAYRDISTMFNLTNSARPGPGVTDLPLSRRVVRDSRRGSALVRDFWTEVNRRDGRLTIAAASYKKALQTGNPNDAERRLSDMDDNEKSFALLNTHFDAKYKRMHPLRRAADFRTVIGSLRTELLNGAGIDETAPWSTEPIILPASTKKRLDDTLAELARRDTRNTMVGLEMPGWKGKKQLDDAKTYDMIYAIDDRVGDELVRRLEKAKVYDRATVIDQWPDLKDRLLVDRDQAFLDDLLSIAEIPTR